MNSWATSGRDLHLSLEPGQGRREGLERALRAAIREGRLAPGARLPSTRALARDLGLARGTVTEAYAQLVAEGYLRARHGSGTVVAQGTVSAGVESRPSPAAIAPPVDFRAGRPDSSSFPRALWLAAARRALRGAPDAAFDYGDPRGCAELRSTLSAYLGRARGVRTSPQLIVVCSGFSQALAVLCRVLSARGAGTLGMEDPCIPDHRAIAAAGTTVVNLPVDGDGLQTDMLARRAPDAVMVTPAHQCVLGGTMAPARRSALVRWARGSGGVVIEDDYDGEFRYDRQPVGALQGLDPERIIYAGTASKTLAPGLRLGWLAVPPSLIEPVVEAKRLTDRHSGVLDQLTLAELIESGGFDRHVRRMRLRYRRRRDQLVVALAERVPALQPTGIAAGLHVVLRLPSWGPTEEDALASTAERGIALAGLSGSFSEAANRRAGLMIGYAAPPEHTYATALRKLVDALADLWPAGRRIH